MTRLAKADVYSFALVCSQVLNGRVPYSNLSSHLLSEKVLAGMRPELPVACPYELVDLLKRCWDGRPSKRPSFDYICKELEILQISLLTGETNRRRRRPVVETSQKEQNWLKMLKKVSWSSRNYRGNIYIELAKGLVAREVQATVDHVELDRLQSLRLSRALEELLEELDRNSPSLKLRRLELIKHLCLTANRSEVFFKGGAGYQWLKTTIYFNEPSILSLVYFPVSMKAEYDTLELAGITIHSNVLPFEAYKTKSWAEMDEAVSIEGKGHFFESTILDDALLAGKSLTQQMNEWRSDGKASELQVPQRALVSHPKFKLWQIKPTDLTVCESMARGSFGNVFKVIWREGTFAGKASSSRENQFAFEMDLRVAEMISHPHIVHMFGLCSDEDKHTLLMELMDEDLFSFCLEKRRLQRRGQPPFTLLDSLDVLLQVAEAMEHLHGEHIIHGDLKPSNILISSLEVSLYSEHYLVKVTDFGSAKFVASDLASSFKPDPGTTMYSAPEVLAWREFSDSLLTHPKMIDVYSFGILAHEVLTGLEPYPDMAPREIKAGVRNGTLRPWLRAACRQYFDLKYPQELIMLIEGCWAANPVIRPCFDTICHQLRRLKGLAVTDSVGFQVPIQEFTSSRHKDSSRKA